MPRKLRADNKMAVRVGRALPAAAISSYCYTLLIPGRSLRSPSLFSSSSVALASDQWESEDEEGNRIPLLTTSPGFNYN
jgi:hypothetical protein